jgi:hypothetical protein
MFVLQKKLIFTPSPNSAIFASYFEVAGRAGRQAHPKSDEKIIIQYRVVSAVGCMGIVAYHEVYLNQLA